MLDRISRLFGKSAAPNEAKRDYQQLNQVAPLKTQDRSAGEAAHKDIFICRDAILNRDERIGGYLFGLQRNISRRMLEKSTLIQKVQDDALLASLANLKVLSLLGHRLGFIHLSPASLKNSQLESFAGLNMVILLDQKLAQPGQMTEIRADLDRLKTSGLQHGWILDRFSDDIRKQTAGADYIEIATENFAGNELQNLCRSLRENSREQHFIASGLHNSEEFRLCFHSGFNEFMGPFVSSRENWHPAKSEINRMKILQVLNQIRNGAKFEDIAQSLRTESVLSFKLLKYINSPGMGLLQHISDISQALMVLGRDKFYRWMSLMLLDFTKQDYQENVFNEQVLARAHFMEQLAGQGSIPRQANELFMTGLFSLLDVMMAQPLDQLLSQVSLPEQVLAALKGENNGLRHALLLAITIESGTSNEISAAAGLCGLNATEVSTAMLEALGWAQQASAAG